MFHSASLRLFVILQELTFAQFSEAVEAPSIFPLPVVLISPVAVVGTSVIDGLAITRFSITEGFSTIFTSSVFPQETRNSEVSEMSMRGVFIKNVSKRQKFIYRYLNEIQHQRN